MALNGGARRLWEQLERARLGQGMSPADCAEVMGMKLARYEALRKAGKSPTLLEFARLVERMGLHMDDFKSTRKPKTKARKAGSRAPARR
jgi:hypothetical protein